MSLFREMLHLRHSLGVPARPASSNEKTPVIWQGSFF